MVLTLGHATKLDQINRIRKENAKLKKENEILKKTMPIFVKKYSHQRASKQFMIKAKPVK